MPNKTALKKASAALENWIFNNKGFFISAVDIERELRKSFEAGEREGERGTKCNKQHSK